MENKHSKTILLVDDDADDRSDFREALQEIDASIHCVFAKDGQQALKHLRDGSGFMPDAIFLDLRLPRINGKDCLLHIKADERLKSIPVIIYTTSKDEDVAEELQALGAVHFISKPEDPEEIFYILSLVLEERWGDIDNK